MRLETGGITHHQRAFHRRRLRFCLRNNGVEGLFCRGRITQTGLRHGDPALHIEGERFAVLCRGQLRQRRARRVLVALGKVNLGQAEDRVFVLRFALQDGVVGGFRGLMIATLFSPVRQR